MAHGLTRKEIKHDEVLEAAHDLGDWLEIHWKRVAIGLGAALALLVLVLGWRGVREARVHEANELLGEGERILRTVGDPFGGTTASYADATAKFDEAAAKGGSSAVGEIARYYGGISRLRSGDLAGAVGILESLANSAGDTLIRENSKVSLALAYGAQGKVADAERLLREVASDPAAVFPPEQALLALAGLYRDAGDAEAAEGVQKEILERYPATSAAQELRAPAAQ